MRSTSISDEVNIFDPNLRTPYTQSWSFGIQRELTRSMVLEVRYLGNRHLQEWTARDLNERNLVENGFLDEFCAPMGNLQANIAAGRGANFRYYGPGTGTSPLPITLAYFGKVPPSQAGDQAKHTSSLFASSTFVNALVKTNPAPGSFATSLWNDAARRSNALAAGLHHQRRVHVVQRTHHRAAPAHRARSSRADQLHVRQGPRVEPGVLEVNFNGTTCASAPATCGRVTSTNSAARRIQIVLRLNF